MFEGDFDDSNFERRATGAGSMAMIGEDQMVPARVSLCVILSYVLAASPLWGQQQSRIQYGYDPAGNLVQVTRSAVTLQPDLTISNLSIGVIAANTNGSFSIPVAFQVNNIGTSAALAPWYDRGYLSANAVLHETDQALGGYNTRTTTLDVGATYLVGTTFTTSTTTVPGNYQLIVRADGGAGAAPFSPTGVNLVPESDETNNTQSVVVNLPANPKPDLSLSNMSVGGISVNQAGAYSFPVTYTVTNVGAVSSAPTWTDLAYLSVDSSLDNGDQNLKGNNTRNTALASGASYTVTTAFSTTATTGPGSYTLFIKTDGHGTTTGGTNTDNGAIVEVNEANNTQALALTLPTKPDLSVSNVNLGAISVSQAGAYSFPVTYTVTNGGEAAAAPTWTDLAYLSPDATLDNTDQNLKGNNTRNTALAAGASYTATTTFTTTATTAPGNYTLFIKTDGHGTTTGGTNTDNGALVEGNEANNTQTLALTLPTKPDLSLGNVNIGAIVKNANGSRGIAVTYTVTNLGGATAATVWNDLAYLSNDTVLDNADPNLTGTHTHSTALAAGASYTLTTTFTTSTTVAAGSYTLFIKTDGNGTTTGGTNTDNGVLAEANEANNVVAIAVVLP